MAKQQSKKRNPVVIKKYNVDLDNSFALFVKDDIKDLLDKDIIYYAQACPYIHSMSQEEAKVAVKHYKMGII